jgi:GcrA cell cycle regulator
MTALTWTSERVALLKSRIAAGLTCAQVAREIGVSRNAVIGKVNRLGLSRLKSATAAPSARAVPQTIAHRMANRERIAPALRRKQQPAPIEIPVESAHRRSLLELQRGHCRWPISEPGAHDFGFCGNKQLDGLPYCAGHARMAYRPPGRVNAFRREHAEPAESIDHQL